MKLTPWFPANVNPVRAGVYKVKSPNPWYRYWDGTNWYAGASTPIGARKICFITPCQASVIVPWRGLAEEPK